MKKTEEALTQVESKNAWVEKTFTQQDNNMSTLANNMSTLSHAMAGMESHTTRIETRMGEMTRVLNCISTLVVEMQNHLSGRQHAASGKPSSLQFTPPTQTQQTPVAPINFSPYTPYRRETNEDMDVEDGFAPDALAGGVTL